MLGFTPPNRKAIDERKLYPSQVYDQKEVEAVYKPVAAKKLALISLEEELDEATIKKYECRMEEGYDCTDDLLYFTWKKLKLQSSSGDHTKQQTTRAPLADLTNQQTTSTHKDIFQIPVATTETRPPKAIRGTACLPKHISGDKVIKLLEEKKAKKEMEERKKEERQQQREERRKKKEQQEKEKARKKEERQKEQRRKKEQKEKEKEQRKKKEQKKAEQDSTDEECECPICNIPYSDECDTSTIWIECEVCGRWYHLECTGLQIEQASEDIEFICKFCV